MRNSSPGLLWRLSLAIVLLAALAGQAAAADLTPEMLLGGPLDAAAPERAALALAIERFQSRAPDEAFRALQRAVQQQPKLPPAELLMARLCFAAQQAPQGRGWLERAAVAAPGDPETYVLLGGLAMREGRLTEAGLLYQAGRTRVAAYEANPARRADLDARISDGQIAVAELRQDWPEAERLLRERREKPPAAPGSAFRLARALFAQKKTADAETLLKAEYDAAKKAGDAFAVRPEINLALLHEERAGQLAEGPERQELRRAARQLMAAAIKADGVSVATQLAVARWALETGDLPIATRCAGEAAKLAPAGDPARGQAQWIAAVAAHGQGDLAAAEKLLRDLVRQAPQDVQLRNQLALVLAERAEPGPRDEAWKLAEQNAKEYPAVSSPLGRNLAVTLAFALHRLGKAAEAEKVLAPMVEAGGLAGDAWYLVARIYVDRGEKDRAAQLLRPVVESQVVFLWREKAKALLESLK